MDWLTLILTHGGLVVAAAFGLWKAYREGKLGDAIRRAVETFKEDQATLGEPEPAKALTDKIATIVDSTGLTKLNEKRLKKKGLNLKAILSAADTFDPDAPIHPPK